MSTVGEGGRNRDGGSITTVLPLIVHRRRCHDFDKISRHAGAHIQNIFGGGAFRSGTDFYVRV